MTYAEFTATRAPVSDDLWGFFVADGWVNELPREAVFEYGEGYVLHEIDGGFYPHAWWYAPVRKATREEAEAVLWEWRKEWV